MLCSRQFFQHKISQYADDCSADDTGDHKHRKVYENLEIRYEERGDKQLAEVVRDAACHGDTRYRKQPALFHKHHHKHAEQSACHGIEHAENTGKQQTSDKYPDDVYQQRIACSEVVQRDDDHKIGNPQLDAGYSEIERDQHLYI